MNTEAIRTAFLGPSPESPTGSHSEITWPTPQTDLAITAPVRVWIRDALRGEACPLREDTALIVTEMVTNAIRHGGGLFALSLTFRPANGVLVEVCDASPETFRPECPHLQPVHGFGFRLITSLAHDWGQVSHPFGKTVWAHLTPYQTRPGV